MKLRRIVPLVSILVLMPLFSACQDAPMDNGVAEPASMDAGISIPDLAQNETSVSIAPSTVTPIASPSPKAAATPEPSPTPAPTATASPTPTPAPSPVKTQERIVAATPVSNTAEVVLTVPSADALSAAQTPMPTQQTTPRVTGTPVSDQVQLPYIEYDQAAVRAEFLRGMNDAKAAGGYPAATLSSELNATAQERADQMAAEGKAWHIGDGFSEAVGSITGRPGAYNRGYHSISHSPPLAGYVNIGIGVAIAEDRMIYYSIIGSMATE